MTGIRSENPIWHFVDKDLGISLDDTYYVHFLTNTMPYIPQNVYQDDTLSTPWANPLQLTAGGTLPDNLYFDPTLVYRIEIRQGATSSDPLAYDPIENYVPAGGSTPPPPVSTSITSDNQVSNPQFSLIDFIDGDSEELVITGETNPEISIGPSWTLIGVGTGSFTIQRISAAGNNNFPTNPPYILSIASSGGFSEVYLRQRFAQNGGIWSRNSVSGSFTAAQLDGSSPSISMSLVDSNGSTTTVISSALLTGDYQQFTNAVDLPDSTNPDLPPAAYTDLVVDLPTTATIGITSIQILSLDVAVALPFEEETIERQQDHLFHYYRNDFIIKPKRSILVGWDFSVNPWQFRALSQTTVSSQTQYIIDQTIIHQKNGANTVATQQRTAPFNNSLAIKALTSSNEFALINYVPNIHAKSCWSTIMSSLVTARLVTTQNSNVQIRMKLIYRDSAPSTISPTEPIASWSGEDPVFAAGWTEVNAINSPTYRLQEGGIIDDAKYSFDGFSLPAGSNVNSMFALVIYTVGDMSTTGPDEIQFKNISFTPGRFASESIAHTFDETLRQCQFFYEKSYENGALPGTVTADNAIFMRQNQYFSQVVSSDVFHAVSAPVFFPYKQTKLKTPSGTIYAVDGTPGAVQWNIRWLTGTANELSGTVSLASYFSAANFFLDNSRWDTAGTIQYAQTVPANDGSVPETTAPTSFLLFHYTLNSQLGI
jgi:hypothetical protein